MKFRLEVKGNKAVAKFMDKVNAKAVKGIEGVLDQTAWDIDGDARNRAPHVTGFLLGKFMVQRKDLTARIENTAIYAPYVEFGTGGLVDVPKGLESYAMQFKGKNIKQVNLPPRPFLFPAWEAKKPQFVKDLKEVLKDSTK